MNNGWIKLHRKILDNPRLAEDNDYLVVWIKLLMLVKYEDTRALFKGKEITLKAGQIITGRKWLAKFCNEQQSKVERILKWLESEHQIEQQTTNKNRLITITKWSYYQQTEQQDEQQVNNKRTTKPQKVNTYKEYNTRNKEYKKKEAATFKDFENYATSKGYEDRDLELEWEKMNNWLEGRKQPTNWKNFWLNWLKKTKADPATVAELNKIAEQKQREEYEKRIESESCKDASQYINTLKQNLINKLGV